jgi:hypothetical protein
MDVYCVQIGVIILREDVNKHRQAWLDELS